MKNNNLNEYWKKIFENWKVVDEFEKDYMLELSKFLKKEN